MLEQIPFEILVDYLSFLYNESNQTLSNLVPNSHIAKIFEQVLDGCVFELCFSEHMKKNNLDILEKVEKILLPIDIVQSNKIKTDKINAVFSQLREPENQIINRINLFPVVSQDILKPIIQS